MSNPVTTIIRRLAAEVREWKRWEALQAPEDIRVYYGMPALPGPGDPVSGGIVKCMDLAERFPNAAGKANLLYLVSSALPARRDLLARAARRAGAPFVLNQNGVAYPGWAGPEWKTINAPNTRMHAAADFVVYQSEFCRRCAEQFLGPREGPGEVLYNPVDTDVFCPDPEKQGTPDEPLLLVAGSHHDAYRVRLVIEALSDLRREGRPVRLQVAGRLVWSGDAEREARQWTREAGVEDAVRFSGPYTQQEAPALMRGADLLVHLKVQDPCPRLVVEAMACGVPVVYTANGGTPELVGEEAGIGLPAEENFERMVPPERGAVADAIRRALHRREELGRQARERAVGCFAVSNWVQAHADLFERLAGRGDG